MMDLDKILSIRMATLMPEQGRLLISNPFLSDYFFRRSVVLLIDHGDDGSFGVIINKPMDFTVAEVTSSFPAARGKVYLGGPVKTDGLFYIHTLGNSIPESIQIMDGLWWGGKLEVLEEIISADPARALDSIRFYLGYSGWVSEQLGSEIKARSWLITNADPKEIMEEQVSDLWSQKVQSMGKPFDTWLRFPADPSFN
ncbi:MAG: YqgE/AlgH family protein [Bacteroidales bacterium]